MTTPRSGRRVALGFGLALVAAFALGCTTSGPLQVENATDIDVGVYADGTWVGTYAAGRTGNGSISGQGRPQTLEVRSPSGAVLLSLPINDGHLEAGAEGRFGTGSSIGLPCGVITVLIGQLGANTALAPAASVEPGPCP